MRGTLGTRKKRLLGYNVVWYAKYMMDVRFQVWKYLVYNVCDE